MIYVCPEKDRVVTKVCEPCICGMVIPPMTTPSDDAAIVAEWLKELADQAERPDEGDGWAITSFGRIARKLARDRRATLLRLLHTRRDEALEDAAAIADQLDEQCCGDADPERGGCCGRFIQGTGVIAEAIRALKYTATDGSGGKE